MHRKIIFILFLLTNVSVNARFRSTTKLARERRNCILYDLPSKQFCDQKYPNRVTAKTYREIQADMAGLYITIILSILFVTIYYR